MSIDGINSSSSANSLLNLDDQVRMELGGDSGAEIAALLVLGARASRDQSQALRQAQEQRLTQFEKAQVDQMYDQADAIRSAGWSKGLGLMVGGTLNVLSATVTNDPQTIVVLKSSDQIAQGVGDIGRAIAEGTAKQHEANAVSVGNLAKKAERAISDLTQSETEAEDLRRTALQAASDLIQAEARGAEATLYLRG
jgi:hypothetical protein